MNSDSVDVVHLVKLINADDTSVSQHHGSSLQLLVTCTSIRSMHKILIDVHYAEAHVAHLDLRLKDPAGAKVVECYVLHARQVSTHSEGAMVTATCHCLLVYTSGSIQLAERGWSDCHSVLLHCCGGTKA